MARMKSLGKPWIHEGIECDDCHVSPIIGYRFKCETCPDHDLCSKCYAKKESSTRKSGCKFLRISVDSSKFYPPFQIYYYECNQCHAVPIQGVRYHHKWHTNFDLCSDCFEKTTEPPDSFLEMEETKINTICKTYFPVYHYHKICMQCGQHPISGPRFDSIVHISTGIPGGEEDSLCLMCFDLNLSKKTIESTNYQRVERPEVEDVIHMLVYSCFQCGDIPICGPAYLNKRIPDESLCLLCYQHIDPGRWQFEYERIEPPSQYGMPPSYNSSLVQDMQALRLQNLFGLNNNSVPGNSSSSGLNNSFNASSGDNGTKDIEDADIDKLNSRLNSAILEEKPNVKWDDVAGLENAKKALYEAVVFPVKYPHFFVGDRKPWNAFLLYGPPGTGKSYLARAVATEVKSTFFSISASDLGSKWLGESEKLVSLLFKKARKAAPSIIFIDEIDSIAGKRTENDVSGVKTEILVQMQGVGNNNDKVLVLAATNLPYNLDQALRRRFDKRIYIALPDHAARKQMFKIHVKKTPHSLTEVDFEDLATRTPGFSGSDISVCVKDVLWAPLRRIQKVKFFRSDKNYWYPCEPSDPGAVKITMKQLEAKGLASKIKPPPITMEDFSETVARQRPTVSEADLRVHQKFTKEFGEEGTTSVNAVDVSDEDESSDKLQEGLNSAIVKETPNVKWSDVAGLESAKQALHEAVVLPIKHPQFFTGNRKPWTSFLLYGPPGTGKSYLAKAVATEVESTFFSISSADLASKWHGESEKLVSLLFRKARKCAPSIIFIDEIDSICGNRVSDSTGGSEINMRVKTEMLVQMQGVGNKNEKLLILAATNLPYSLDPAIRRRFDKRIHIPLPDHAARKEMFRLQLGNTPHWLSDQDFDELAWRTPGFSGSDIAVCVKGVLFEPVRKVQAAWFFKQIYSHDPATKGQQVWIPCDQYDSGAFATNLKALEDQGWGDKIQLPPIIKSDFDTVLAKQTPTVSQADLEVHIRFTREFGEEG